MDELDLRTLWQEQPIDELAPSTRGGRATIDYAVPTSQFARPVEGRRRAAPLLFAAACALGMLVTAALKFGSPTPAAPDPAPIAAAPDPAEVLEQDLVECRTYADPAGPHDWARARSACEHALELEPIHKEANELLARITTLETCEQDYEGARELLGAGRLEAGLLRLVKVGEGCELYLLRGLALGKAPAMELERQAAADCKAYAGSGKWELALPRCELYARLACQHPEPAALVEVRKDLPRDLGAERRAIDPAWARFLDARRKLEPNAAPWVCPEWVVLRPTPAPPDPAARAFAEFARRYPEPELNRALVLYFQGDFHSAPVPVQKVLEQLSKAQSHEAARALLLDINNAINLYANGTTELTNDRPERAEAPFRKALEIDERLVLGPRARELSPEEKPRELERRLSFLRRSIVEAMGTQTYEKGKGLADRKDFRAACRVWKLGLSFSRAHLDLLRAATNVCTPRALEAAAKASTCEQLRAGLDFAVPGDGAAERLTERLTDEGCR